MLLTSPWTWLPETPTLTTTHIPSFSPYFLVMWEERAISSLPDKQAEMGTRGEEAEQANRRELFLRRIMRDAPSLQASPCQDQQGPSSSVIDGETRLKVRATHLRSRSPADSRSKASPTAHAASWPRVPLVWGRAWVRGSLITHSSLQESESHLLLRMWKSIQSNL